MQLNTWQKQINKKKLNLIFIYKLEMHRLLFWNV